MKNKQSSIEVSISLISLSPDQIGARLCPNCSHPMDLHQPDSGFPDRMLWTCHHCSTWFLMDIDAGSQRAVLVCLPDHGHFFQAIG